MARAFAVRITTADAEGDTVNAELSVIYYGDDVPVPLVYVPVNVIITGTDTLTQMGVKVVDAMVAKGTQLGLSVARAQCVAPSLFRGS